jgi:hypothetical protein
MKKNESYIYWEQAAQFSEKIKKENIAETERLIKEIETSNFSCLDARDINYYANELNRFSNRTKENGDPDPYTPNEVRRMNMIANDLNSYDLLNTFIEDELDSVIDFY